MSMVSMTMSAVKTSAACCQRCTVAVLGAKMLLNVSWPRRSAIATDPAIRCADENKFNE